MKKFRFRQPLREILFTQAFGENKWAYSSFAPGVTGGHIGLDFSFGDGDEVRAFYGGEVVYVSDDTIVIISEIDDAFLNIMPYETVYAHCIANVFPGQIVKDGEVIGRQSYRGPSVMWQSQTPNNEKIAWSHLHFGMRSVGGDRLNHYTPAYWDYASHSHRSYHYPNNLGLIKETDGFIDPSAYSELVVERIIDAIESIEGAPKFWNNPGALRYSPHQDGEYQGRSGKFSTFKTYEKGRFALRRQLVIAADGVPNNSIYKPGLSVVDFFRRYAPKNDNNDPVKYAKDVVELAGLRSVNDPISDWLLTEVEWLKKYNYNPWYSYPEVNVVNSMSPGEETKGVILAGIVKDFKAIWNIFFRDKR